MTLIGWVRARRIRRVVAEQAQFYARPWTATERDAWQLEQLNRLWSDYLARVPHVREMGLRGRVPSQFSSWREFEEVVPPTGRGDLQAEVASHVDALRPADDWRSTGGSTGTPLRLPVWNAEAQVQSADFWLARSWFSVSPADRLVLLWGHAHLLGSGLRGRALGMRRSLQDRLLGYHRISAYDLSDEGMRAASRVLLEVRPSYLLGYSVALDRLARVNLTHAAALRDLRLKVIVATAEAFPRSDSAALLADTFACKVAMEYGAVETGAIAHQQPDGAYSVFWRHYRLEVQPSAEVDGAGQILVTSLYPRCLPLLRYRLGDLARRLPSAEVERTFAEVVGRCNEVVHLEGGRSVHSEAFAHALRWIDGVDGYQVVQRAGEAPTLSYTGARLTQDAEGELRRRLRRIAEPLGAMKLEHRAALPQTVAGKTLRLRRER